MQRYKKYLFILIVSAMILAFAMGWGVLQRQSKEEKYNKAKEMMECGSYEAAMEEFQALGYYKDSILCFLDAKTSLEKSTSDYEYALDLLDNRQYEDAIEVFKKLGGFKDSKEKVVIAQESQYSDAMAFFNNGYYEQAHKYFTSLGDYKDCNRMAELSMEKMSEEDTQEMMYQAACREFGARRYRSALAHFNQLQDYKDSLSMAEKCQKALHQNYQVIGAGVQHSAAIQRTGEIIFTGSNANKQCDISDWASEGIVSIDCGGVMTIGLKDNGQVLVSTDYGSFNANEWKQWENIIAVSAGYSYVVGLKEDGTVVGTGHDAGDGQLDINSWENVVAIATGWRHTVGLTADGTVLITGYRSASQLRQIANHKEDWSNIIAIAAGGGHNNPSYGNGHTVGLKSDGTVVAVGDNTFGQCNVDGWTDIVAIAAGDSHTVGLRSDGTVLTTGEFETNLRLGDEWTDIVAIAAGTAFTLGLKYDGTVLATGYDFQHQIPKPDEWKNVLIYSDWASAMGLDITDEYE